MFNQNLPLPLKKNLIQRGVKQLSLLSSHLQWPHLALMPEMNYRKCDPNSKMYLPLRAYVRENK